MDRGSFAGLEPAKVEDDEEVKLEKCPSPVSVAADAAVGAAVPAADAAEVKEDAGEGPRGGPQDNGDVNVDSGSGCGGGGRGGIDGDGLDRIKARDIFIGNLSLFTDESKLRAHFSRFGYVEDVRIMYHPETKRSRRFGFVTFAEEAAVQAVLGCPQQFLDGKVLDTKHAFKKSSVTVVGPDTINNNNNNDDQKHPLATAAGAPAAACKTPPSSSHPSGSHVKVFVGGIGQDATEEDVRNYFSQFGKVDSTHLLPDSVTGRHRGFGFLSFADDRTLELVCSVRFHILKGKKVEVKLAEPKRDPPKQQQQQHNLVQQQLRPCIGGGGLEAQDLWSAAAAAAAAAASAAASAGAEGHHLHHQGFLSYPAATLHPLLHPPATHPLGQGPAGNEATTMDLSDLEHHRKGGLMRYSPYNLPTSSSNASTTSASLTSAHKSPSDQYLRKPTAVKGAASSTAGATAPDQAGLCVVQGPTATAAAAAAPQLATLYSLQNLLQAAHNPYYPTSSILSSVLGYPVSKALSSPPGGNPAPMPDSGGLGSFLNPFFGGDGSAAKPSPLGALALTAALGGSSGASGGSGCGGGGTLAPPGCWPSTFYQFQQQQQPQPLAAMADAAAAVAAAASGTRGPASGLALHHLPAAEGSPTAQNPGPTIGDHKSYWG